ncbi:MAG: ApaG domain [Pleurocapsa sp. SU_196_0]|nr:ApaG domain [Pleurocapsa sp. SU_196_0]
MTFPRTAWTSPSKSFTRRGDSVANRLYYIYFVTMTNTGSLAAKLLRRHFLIRDGNGFEQEVDGEGVVGEQPKLEPGETYRYNSGVPIACPAGSMGGYYTFVNAEGEVFMVELPTITLYEPVGYVPPVNASLDMPVSAKNRVIN